MGDQLPAQWALRNLKVVDIVVANALFFHGDSCTVNKIDIKSYFGIIRLTMLLHNSPIQVPLYVSCLPAALCFVAKRC